jgi:hypothetical protein
MRQTIVKPYQYASEVASDEFAHQSGSVLSTNQNKQHIESTIIKLIFMYIHEHVQCVLGTTEKFPLH